MSDYAVEVVSSVEALEERRAAWEELADRSLEDNIYLHPDYLTENLRVRRGAYFVLFVYDRSAGNNELVGVAPFNPAPPNLWVPVPRVSTLDDFHVYLSYPLVDATRGAAAIRAIWDWLDGSERSFHLVVVRNIDRRSATWSLIREELERRDRSYWVKRTFHQAALRRRESFDAYLKELSRARRKGYRRKLRQLESEGGFRLVLHRNFDQAPDLTKRYLDLELKSWKGDKNVALAQNPDNRHFFEKVTKRFAARDELFFVELAHERRSVAISVNFTCGRTVFGLRIAFDPEYHTYSPGTVSELETVRLFHEDPVLQHMQGGNDAEDSYLNHYWFDLAEMQVISVATPSLRSRLYLQAAPKVQASLDRLSALRAPASVEETGARVDSPQGS
jgi:CelD/BcsL family acetyltransferase involved in cellulose biosynthesis